MTEILVLSTAVFLGAAVSGFAGFAFSAAAGAILLHFFEPRLVIPLMMLCSVVSQTATLVVLRKSVRWRETTSLLIGAGIGVPIALYLFTYLEATLFRTIFGVFLASYALYLLRRIWTQSASAAFQRFEGRISQSFVGFAGGLVGGFTAMPGVAIAIWCELRGNSKEQQRGLVQPFIIATQIVALALLFSYPGMLQQDLLKSSLLAMPALAAGTFLGMSMFGRVSDKTFRICVLFLLLASGCGLIHWQSVLPIVAQAAMH